jgi:hypothetical protein
MNFLQKNKSVLVVLLMVGFLVVILSIFFSGISGSGSTATPTDSLPQPINLATSTGGVPSTPIVGRTPLPAAPAGTSAPPPGVTVQATQVSAKSSPPPSTAFAATVSMPGTDAPPPPTVNFAVTDDGPPGTDFPPPDVFQPLPTETPPPGNGPPPGS